MTKKKGRKRKKDFRSFTGPGDDCSCPVCIFSRSQAPGDSYLLSKCPKWNAKQKKDRH